MQNYRAPGLSRFLELFFYWKRRGICPRSHGPGPRQPAHAVYGFSLNGGHWLHDQRSRSKHQRGIRSFNLGHWSLDVRWRRLLLHHVSAGKTEAGRRHGRRLGAVLAWVIGHQMWRGFFLCDLGDKRNQICLLTTEETDGGELAVMGRLCQSSTVVATASGGAPTPGTALVAPLVAGTPPSSSSAREGLTQRGKSASSGGYGC
jgi:hypothetical protein